MRRGIATTGSGSLRGESDDSPGPSISLPKASLPPPPSKSCLALTGLLCVSTVTLAVFLFFQNQSLHSQIHQLQEQRKQPDVVVSLPLVPSPAREIPKGEVHPYFSQHVLRKFLAVVKSTGADTSKVRLHLDSDGFHLFAATDLKHGEIFIETGPSLMITDTDAMKSRFGTMLAKLENVTFDDETNSTYETMIWYMAYLKSYDSFLPPPPPAEGVHISYTEAAAMESHQAVLMSVAPETCGSMNYFSNEELLATGDVSMHHEVVKLETSLRVRYFNGLSAMYNETGTVNYKRFPFETYKWAWACFTSRFFNLDDDHTGIAFVADMMNHEDLATCGVWDEQTNTDYFSWDGNRKTMVFRAGKDLKAGEHLTLCYKDHNNHGLMVNYGFSLENNRFETCAIYDFEFHRQSLEEDVEQFIAHLCGDTPATQCTTKEPRVASLLELYQTKLQLHKKDSALLKNTKMSWNMRFAITHRNEAAKLATEALSRILPKLGIHPETIVPETIK